MPLKPTRAGSDDGEYQFVVRMTGKLKNSIIDLCLRENCSLNDWALTVIQTAVRAGKGLPAAPPATRAPPGTLEQIRAYVTGERMLMPCGKQKCNMILEKTGSLEFCTTCGIRTR